MKSRFARSPLGRLIAWIRTPYDYREYDPFETVHITQRLISEQGAWPRGRGAIVGNDATEGDRVGSCNVDGTICRPGRNAE